MTILWTHGLTVMVRAQWQTYNTPLQFSLSRPGAHNII